MSYPPLSNIKMFIDSIGRNVMLEEDFPIISFIYHTITCTSYRHHKTIPTRWNFIFMELSLDIFFLFYYFIIVYFIIMENKQKVKEIIRIIHIQPFINSFAWALRAFFILQFITFNITG